MCLWRQGGEADAKKVDQELTDAKKVDQERDQDAKKVDQDIMEIYLYKSSELLHLKPHAKGDFQTLVLSKHLREHIPQKSWCKVCGPRQI